MPAKAPTRQKRHIHRTARAGKFIEQRIKPVGVRTLRVGKRGAKLEKRGKAGTVVEQFVYGPDGRLKSMLTIDAGSTTFGNELRYAFERNVARARRENKKKFGSPDVTIRK